MDYLNDSIQIPIEREFEAWIMRGIKDYFDDLDFCVNLFAVRPDDESTWPSDEVVECENMMKILGLQFKKPILETPHSSPNDFSRLKWDLSNPPNQFNRVANFDEIFYCLPTFINRNIQEIPLHHCLLWDPTEDDPDYYQVWYDQNDDAMTDFVDEKDSDRWGLFWEKVLACDYGKEVSNGFDFRGYLDDIFQEEQEINGENPDGQMEEIFTFITLADRPASRSRRTTLLL